MSLGHGASIVRDGLVLHLDAANVKSYPGSGTTWSDLSGNGNHGTLVNSPLYDPNNNGSIVFGGTDEYVSFNSPIILQDFTASCIYKVTSYSNNWAMFFGQTDTDSFIGQHLTYLRVQDSSSLSSDLTRAATNSLEMLTVNQTGTTNNWYINGEFIGSSTNTSYSGMDIQRLVYYADGSTLGVWSGNYYVSMLYNRALTESEIKQNYNAMRSRYGI